MSISCALNAATAGRDLAIDDYVALAARQGYRWVEFDRAQILALTAMGVSAARELLERNGTRIASFFLPVAWRGEEREFQRDMETFGDVVTAAAALGATRCCTWLLPNFPTPPAETRRWVGARFGAIARLLAAHELSFGLEFIGPAHFRSEPGYTFIYRLEDMLAFAEEIGPNTGVLVDSLHWHCTGATSADLARVSADRLIYAHIDDAPDLSRDQLRDDARLLPGEGVIDLTGFLCGLQAAGYDGPIGIEVDGPALQDFTPDEAAARARRAWDSVLARATMAGA
jgi:sugar phosphate isomerase/epimerase